jgi:transcription initiation factor TFIID subunit 2
VERRIAGDAGCFVGALKVRVVERDGTYEHAVHIEARSHTFDIPYHGKHRRPKRAPEGPEEETLGLDQADSPVCWLRIDPDYGWLRVVELVQPDYMWMEQVYKEKDVLAQAEVIIYLSNEFC